MQRREGTFEHGIATSAICVTTKHWALTAWLVCGLLTSPSTGDRLLGTGEGVGWYWVRCLGKLIEFVNLEMWSYQSPHGATSGKSYGVPALTQYSLTCKELAFFTLKNVSASDQNGGKILITVESWHLETTPSSCLNQLREAPTLHTHNI